MVGPTRVVRRWLKKDSVRVVALVATYNEERFIGSCLEHLIEQGVQVYLIDNSSSDRTVEIAERYLGRGLIDIETFPRAGGVYKWRSILERQEQLAPLYFWQTMRWYYPSLPRFPPRLNAGKRKAEPVGLAPSGGHRVRFPGL